MSILTSLAEWPLPFDYERALAIYRQRPAAQPDNGRLRAHLESIRFLECDRDYALESAEQLAAFQPASAKEICRAVAASSGEVLWPVVDPAIPQSDDLPATVEELQAHLDQCAFCRLMADDLRTEHYRQQNLPPAEMTLHDWLLDHYIREPLNNLTRQLLPDRAECLAAVERLSQSIRASGPAREQLLQINFPTVAQRSVKDNVETDVHFFMALGGVVSNYHCSPIAYTRLYAAPRELRWRAPRGPHQFRLQVRELPGAVLVETPITASAYELTTEERQKIPAGKTIKWTVFDADAPVLTALFKVLTDDERQQLHAQLDDTAPPTLSAQLSLVSTLWERELFDAAVQVLDDLQRRFCLGAPGFVVNRMLAGVWRSSRDQLRQRQILTEVNRVNEQVTQALQAAYQALPN